MFKCALDEYRPGSPAAIRMEKILDVLEKLEMTWENYCAAPNEDHRAICHLAGVDPARPANLPLP